MAPKIPGSLGQKWEVDFWKKQTSFRGLNRPILELVFHREQSRCCIKVMPQSGFP